MKRDGENWKKGEKPKQWRQGDKTLSKISTKGKLGRLNGVTVKTKNVIGNTTSGNDNVKSINT